MGFFSKKTDDNAKSEKDAKPRGMGIKQPMMAQSLSDITRGMHHAALATSNMLVNQYLYLLSQFFDEDEKGQLKAKMVDMQLDDSHSMKVPLISMVAPKGIVMDKMKVALSVRMEETEIKRATHDIDNSEATRTAFKVQLSPHSDGSAKSGRPSDIIDIEMEFSSIEPPEGIMKLIDEYVNMISPYKTNEKKEEA